jgi:uracil phosphoribosyltransferase
LEIHVLNERPSMASHYLAELRDVHIQQDRHKFRHNLSKLGQIVAFEISKRLEYQKQAITTPLGEAEEYHLENWPVIIAIIRAALPFFEGIQKMFDQSDAGFIGAYRVSKSSEGNDIDINMDYTAMPKIDSKDVILADPMLATGKSIIRTINNLREYGSPKSIHIATVIASKDGVDYVMKQTQRLPVTIWSCAIDAILNEKSYIVPGLGDAGDLAYGMKH